MAVLCKRLLDGGPLTSSTQLDFLRILHRGVEKIDVDLPTLSKSFGVTQARIRRTIKELVEVEWLDELRGNSNRPGRPVLHYKISRNFYDVFSRSQSNDRIDYGGWQSRAVCKLISENGSKEDRFTNRESKAKILLLVLIAHADHAGFISALNKKDLQELTGIQRSGINNQLDKLEKAGYLAARAPGFSGDSIFGRTPAVYQLSLPVLNQSEFIVQALDKTKQLISLRQQGYSGLYLNEPWRRQSPQSDLAKFYCFVRNACFKNNSSEIHDNIRYRFLMSTLVVINKESRIVDSLAIDEQFWSCWEIVADSFLINPSKLRKELDLENTTALLKAFFNKNEKMDLQEVGLEKIGCEGVLLQLYLTVLLKYITSGIISSLVHSNRKESELDRLLSQLTSIEIENVGDVMLDDVTMTMVVQYSIPK